MEPFDTPEQPAERTPDPNTPPLFDMPAQQPFGMPAAPAPCAARGFGRLNARMRNPRRTVLASLVATALVATGGVALAANNSGGTPAPGVGSGMRAAHGMVHGEFTVADGKGGYTTELVQRGTVTAFSGGTLTVKSSDGYTHSYTTDSTTAFGRGRGRGHGHGFGQGGWMHGPMNPMGKPNQNAVPAQGNAVGGTATPNTAPSNGTAPSISAPSSTTVPNMVMPNTTTPNMAMPNNTTPENATPNIATPNNTTPNNTTTNTPNITVGETVTVISVHSGNTDHAQRVMPMQQMNTKQRNGQNGFPGGFFGHHRGGHGQMGQFPGMPGMQGQGGTAPAMPGTNGPMNNGNNTGPAPTTGGPTTSTPANPPTSSAPSVASQSQSMPNSSTNSDSSDNGSDSSTSG
ncbi:MAG TPA: hypothetical protein VHV82_16120 [Sporichthyaceae bacterium]|jgi:hypothetical protein|nr:hypothetical protein [Sporichthyaceae bacterium]